MAAPMVRGADSGGAAPTTDAGFDAGSDAAEAIAGAFISQAPPGN